MLINLCLYFIFIIFFVGFSFFLYYGSNIYELITHSNFNYIYTKIDNDLSKIIKSRTPQYIIAENLNNIYKTNLDLKINSINSEIYFFINNTIYKLNIYQDNSKIIPFLINFKNKFEYTTLK